MPQDWFDKNAPTAKDGDWFAENAPPAATTPINQRGATIRPDPPTLMERISEYLPSPRTAFRTAGGLIGGSIGATGGTVLGTPIGGVGGAGVGGSAGAAGGEALYQLLQRARGAPSPESGLEAAQDVASAAVQGGVQEIIPAAITAKLPGALQRGSEEAVARLSRPGTEGEKAAVRKVAADAIPNIPVAATNRGVVEAYNKNLTHAVQTLAREFNTVPAKTRFKLGPYIKVLQGERDALLINGKAPAGVQPQVTAYDEVIDWLTNNPTPTITDIRKNKQLWDLLVNWNRGALSKEPAKEQAYEAGANVLRRAIHGVFPKIAEADKQVHTWRTLVDSISRSETKKVGSAGQLGVDAGASIIGGGLGFMAGGPAGGAGGAAVGAMIRQLVQTPAFQTAGIAARQKAITLLQRGDVQGAIKAITAGGAAIPGSVPIE